jgi:hypothetical protein
MSHPPFVTEPELDQLFSQADHSRIAGLLKVQSDERRCKLKEKVLRIARSYDAGLFEAERRPYNREIRKSLENVGKIARKLSLEIAKAHHYAQSDIAWALSQRRRERKLSTGEKLLPYGDPFSNEWMFERENFGAFIDDLFAIEIHLKDHIEKLGRGGRPRGPEQAAIRELKVLWTVRHKRNPEGKALEDFIELCELILRPIASRRGNTPDIAAIVKNVLYGPEPTPGLWEV